MENVIENAAAISKINLLEQEDYSNITVILQCTYIQHTLYDKYNNYIKK
jgi:hypothetical protein